MIHIQHLIRQSTLLRPDQRELLIALLPSMADEQLQKLEQLLGSEESVLGNVLETSIQAAVTSTDTAFLQELESIIHAGNASLRDATEELSADTDLHTAETLLDQA